jgi:hypothetical protein
MSLLTSFSKESKPPVSSLSGSCSSKPRSSLSKDPKINSKAKKSSKPSNPQSYSSTKPWTSFQDLKKQSLKREKTPKEALLTPPNLSMDSWFTMHQPVSTKSPDFCSELHGKRTLLTFTNESLNFSNNSMNPRTTGDAGLRSFFSSVFMILIKNLMHSKSLTLFGKKPKLNTAIFKTLCSNCEFTSPNKIMHWLQL